MSKAVLMCALALAAVPCDEAVADVSPSSRDRGQSGASLRPAPAATFPVALGAAMRTADAPQRSTGPDLWLVTGAGLGALCFLARRRRVG